jgi:putative phage-type endonuclease
MDNLQRTEKWFEQRRGRFTASEIHKLLGVKGLGETGLSLCRKKAQEIVFGRDEEWDVLTYDMQRGVSQEPIAFELFKSEKELDFIEVKKCGFYKVGENSGASPDGLVGTDGVLEIKCPKPEKFFLLVEKEIEAIDQEYIDQMQLQMYGTRRKKCYFVNYLNFNGEHLTHEIIVPRDKSRIDLILERIELAVIERDKIIKTLIENCQFKHLLKPN